MKGDAFSPSYVPTIEWTATPRETQLHAKTAAQREKLVMADNYNQIHITTQASSDESRRKAGRHLRG